MTDQQNKIEPALLDIRQVCELLNISRAGFYRFSSSGRLGILPIKAGRKVLYSRIEIEQYLRASAIAGKFISRREWQQTKGKYLSI